MADRRSPRAFPRWPRWSVTAELIAAWKRAMAARDIGRTELAKMVGLTPSGVTRLLDGQQASSARVPAICEALGVPLPGEPLPDEVVELAKKVPEKKRELAIAYLRLLLRPDE